MSMDGVPVSGGGVPVGGGWVPVQGGGVPDLKAQGLALVATGLTEALGELKELGMVGHKW
ncbi:hypothetical protein [Streptomyces sp. ID05-47C]|uniref:hypothetical protein n=1 Tax=Streptomyces sp. ID05-47C TaxID=3028665 RepID=UPI0029B41E47|nr:hypothetical protein [Streptomyces sp. ID05-47C]MDX3569995.1 hypothetical protein [Streptomyces sp. ID05-47C]